MREIDNELVDVLKEVSNSPTPIDDINTHLMVQLHKNGWVHVDESHVARLTYLGRTVLEAQNLRIRFGGPA